MTNVCPVLAFTGFTREVLGAFKRTHQIEVGPMGGAWFKRTTFPGEGGAADQDALLMQALDVTERVANTVLGERAKRMAREEKRKKKG